MGGGDGHPTFQYTRLAPLATHGEPVCVCLEPHHTPGTHCHTTTQSAHHHTHCHTFYLPATPACASMTHATLPLTRLFSPATQPPCPSTAACLPASYPSNTLPTLPAHTATPHCHACPSSFTTSQTGVEMMDNVCVCVYCLCLVCLACALPLLSHVWDRERKKEKEQPGPTPTRADARTRFACMLLMAYLFSPNNARAARDVLLLCHMPFRVLHTYHLPRLTIPTAPCVSAFCYADQRRRATRTAVDVAAGATCAAA